MRLQKYLTQMLFYNAFADVLYSSCICFEYVFVFALDMYLYLQPFLQLNLSMSYRKSSDALTFSISLQFGICLRCDCIICLKLRTLFFNPSDLQQRSYNPNEIHVYFGFSEQSLAADVTIHLPLTRWETCLHVIFPCFLLVGLTFLYFQIFHRLPRPDSTA